jgi:hypothetical protein
MGAHAKNYKAGTCMRRAIAYTAFACLMLLGTACGADTIFGEKTNPQAEIELGLAASKYYEQQEGLSTNKEAQARVDRIGQALVAYLDKKMYPYRFKVLSPNIINAFCLPGGYIYIYQGLLNALPDDDAVAYVIAHEIAHGYNRHWAKRTENMASLSLFMGIVSAITNDSSVANRTMLLTYFKYSRDDEFYADMCGMNYMWEAGFDLAGALEVMDIFVGMQKHDDTPEYLSTHPNATDRAAKIKAQISELEKDKPRIQKPAITSEAVDAALAGVVGKIPSLQTAQNQWYPLAVGNQWTYQITDASAKTAYTTRVVAKIAVKENAIYRMETSFGENMCVQSQMLATESEVWRRARPNSPASPWVPEFVLGENMPEPVTKGGASYEFLGKEDITLSCGSFPSALKIRKTLADNGGIYDLWFVKGVGLVQRTCKETGVTETLVKYQLAK